MAKKPMPQDDPLYEKIMDFFRFFFNDKYTSYTNHEGYDYEKYYMIIYNYKIPFYNYDIIQIASRYIININQDIKRIKQYEPQFLDLMILILTNNYWNIRFDFTLMIILDKTDNFATIINYFSKTGLFYQLEKINPMKIKYISGITVKRAKYIYNELIKYDKYRLKLAWLGAVAKASYL